MAGVNFRTADGIVHGQLFSGERTTEDRTSCGLYVVTNKSYALAMGLESAYATCVTERITCVVCLGS